MYFLLVTLLFVLGVYIYKWSTATHRVFIERGIAHERPTPLLGNIKVTDFLREAPQLKKQIDLHLKWRNHKIFGYYLLRDPNFHLRDAELIKNVCIKDFEHFMNHTEVGNFETILSKSLVLLKDRKWKDMRNILTPSFTGKKMRLMYELINACSELVVQYVDKGLKSKGGNCIDFEMKDLFTRYTNDVIASAAFGIKVDSFENKENKFFTIGQALTNFTSVSTFKAMLKAILIYFLPRIAKAFSISFLDEKNVNYFRSLVFDAIKYREEHKIIRPDMIHLLMEAQRQGEESQSDKTFSDDDLLAQCLLFFFAGFETVSTCLCFLTYELCMNPAVQRELYEEILSVEEQLNGKPLDYDTLTHMKYLDMVISETLRKWPPANRTDRLCNADVDLLDENNEIVVKLKKGDKMIIPIMPLHYDPENFEQPEEFRPERFSEENKHEIKPFTYLPFGVGPRNCIGNRMALMEVKSIIYHLMINFKLEPAEKTAKDMLNSIVGFQMVPKEKFWIKFVPRAANSNVA